MGARQVAKKPIEIECKEVWRQISNYLDDEVDSGLRADCPLTSRIALTAAPSWTAHVTWSGS